MVMTMRIQAILLFASVGLAQSVQGQGRDSVRVHTLFGDSSAITGGYFALTARYANVLSTDAALFGLGAGVMIHHRLAIGLAGTWSSSVIKNPAYAEHLQADGATNLEGLEMRFGYGGIHVEPSVAYRSPVHLSFPILIGVGGVSYSSPPVNSNSTQRNRTDGQAFFAFEPGVALEINVVGPVRIGLGASYLFTSNLDLPETPSDALRRPMAHMSIKVGSF